MIGHSDYIRNWYRIVRHEEDGYDLFNNQVELLAEIEVVRSDTEPVTKHKNTGKLINMTFWPYNPDGEAGQTSAEPGKAPGGVHNTWGSTLFATFKAESESEEDEDTGETKSQPEGLRLVLNWDDIDARLDDYNMFGEYPLVSADTGKPLTRGLSSFIVQGTDESSKQRMAIEIPQMCIDGSALHSSPVFTVEAGVIVEDKVSGLQSIFVNKEDDNNWIAVARNLTADCNNSGYGFNVFQGDPKGVEYEFTTNLPGAKVGNFTTPPIAVNTGVTSPASNRADYTTLSMESWERWGYNHCGANEKDKHALAKNSRGEYINSGHINCESYYYHDKFFDAPLKFEYQVTPEPKMEMPYRIKVHLQFDQEQKHKHETGEKDGMYYWWSTATFSEYLPPDEEPPGKVVIDPKNSPNQFFPLKPNDLNVDLIGDPNFVAPKVLVINSANNADLGVVDMISAEMDYIGGIVDPTVRDEGDYYKPIEVGNLPLGLPRVLDDPKESLRDKDPTYGPFHKRFDRYWKSLSREERARKLQKMKDDDERRRGEAERLLRNYRESQGGEVLPVGSGLPEGYKVSDEPDFPGFEDENGEFQGKVKVTLAEMLLDEIKFSKHTNELDITKDMVKPMSTEFALAQRSIIMKAQPFGIYDGQCGWNINVQSPGAQQYYIEREEQTPLIGSLDFFGKIIDADADHKVYDKTTEKKDGLMGGYVDGIMWIGPPEKIGWKKEEAGTTELNVGLEESVPFGWAEEPGEDASLHNKDSIYFVPYRDGITGKMDLEMIGEDAGGVRVCQSKLKLCNLEVVNTIYGGSNPYTDVNIAPGDPNFVVTLDSITGGVGQFSHIEVDIVGTQDAHGMEYMRKLTIFAKGILAGASIVGFQDIANVINGSYVTPNPTAAGNDVVLSFPAPTVAEGAHSFRVYYHVNSYTG